MEEDHRGARARVHVGHLAVQDGRAPPRMGISRRDRGGTHVGAFQVTRYHGSGSPRRYATRADPLP
jgi:hypothetical protein